MFAHTKEDVEAWLEVLRSVVPKGVPVTTSEEIALSWEGKGRWTAAPTTEDDDILYRVTAFPNGKTAGGKMLELPASFEKLRILASDALGFAVALAGCGVLHSSKAMWLQVLTWPDVAHYKHSDAASSATRKAPGVASHDFHALRKMVALPAPVAKQRRCIVGCSSSRVRRRVMLGLGNLGVLRSSSMTCLMSNKWEGWQQ